MCAWPLSVLGPGSGVQLTEACSAHKCVFFLLRVELPSGRAETGLFVWRLVLPLVVGTSDSHRPDILSCPARSTLEQSLGGSPRALVWGDESRRQETEAVVPETVVQTA